MKILKFLTWGMILLISIPMLIYLAWVTGIFKNNEQKLDHTQTSSIAATPAKQETPMDSPSVVDNTINIGIVNSPRSIDARAAKVPAATSTTSKDHPFVVSAEQAYAGYLAAESNGDLESFKKYIPKQEYDEFVAQFKTSEARSAVLKSNAKYQKKLDDGFRFIRAEGVKDKGTLLFRRDLVNKNGEQMIMFIGYKVLLEEGSWRIGCIFSSLGSEMGYAKNGTLIKRTEADIEADIPVDSCLSLQ